MTREAFAAIAGRLVTADPALPADEVERIAKRVLRNTPRALRLLRELEADPEIALSGKPSMPRALQRIIGALVAERSSVLRLPVCPGCSNATPDPMIVVSQRPLCSLCAHRARLAPRSCSECGKQLLHTRKAARREYCPPCWDALLPDRQAILRSVLEEVFSAPVSAEDLQEALEGAETTPTGQLKLALECSYFGGDLFRDPTLGSPAFVRLHRALEQSYPEMTPVRCAQCGEDRPLPSVLNGHRVCQRCYKKARAQACSSCGKTRDIAQRLPDGAGICQVCRRRRPDAMGQCITCGETRTIGFRSAEGPVCIQCRFQAAVDVCHKCGVHAPCRFAGTPRAICEACRRTLHPCIRCGKERIVSTRDANGNPICHSCADRTVEQCVSCGKHSRVVGRVDGAPLCDACYRRHPVGFRDCTRCGSHRRIRRTGLCDLCTITDLTADLFPAELLQTNSAVVALRDAMLRSSEQRTVVAFLRPKSVELLRAVLREPLPLTHEVLDQLGSEQATLAVRSALVEHGLLPPVDIHLRRLERWIEESAAQIASVTTRSGFVQYATWKHLRELRALPGLVSSSRASSRRRELRIVLDLLAWTEERGVPLSDLEQSHVDIWAMTGLERHRANGFLRWAHRNKLSRSLGLVRPRPAAPLLGGLTDSERAGLLTRVFADPEISPGTKLAAALISLYGIRPHRIVQIELSQLSTRDGLAVIRLGEEELHLPEELNLVADAVASARATHRLLHTVTDAKWLYPGERSGYPLNASSLFRRLRKINFPTTDARRGAMISLAAEVPPVVLARLTGIRIQTAIVWREAVAASRARYVGELLASTNRATDPDKEEDRR